jgi:hypothetical protein
VRAVSPTYRNALVGWLIVAATLVVANLLWTRPLEDALRILGIALPLTLGLTLLGAWYSSRHPERAQQRQREREELAARPRYE